ncbi:TonB family protein [Sulfurimonas sp.]|uniref:energy transducer TonB family protein n=1 Tax=Sulfurimonas sp. TaxID=2022749 RepID=UPI002AB191D3|nr:TonB family protein [Sulfurimonas sp.]
MIRHSSSFFLSIIFHIILLVSAFFIWKSIPSVKKIECNDKICIKLCDVVSQKQIIKPPSKPKPKQIPKAKKITKPKLDPIPVQKVIKEEFIKEPEVVEEKEEVLQTMEVIIAKSVAVENTMTKQKKVEDDYLQKHIAHIQRLLQENLYYPRRARERGIVGEVRIEFTLSTDAKAHSIRVISSNSEILSRAAVKTIEDLSGEFPKPKEELTITVPMTYSLIIN